MIQLSRRDFVSLVRQCYSQLPPRVQPYLDNLDIVVEEWPATKELVEVQVDAPDGLLGLYTGVSLVDRGGDLPTLPDKITLFQRPIESICASKEEVVREIGKTLLHEVGHYLGIDEEGLEELGYG